MIEDALHALGRDEATRARIIAALQAYEQLHRFSTVRDDVTGPIVDALHAAVPVVRKELNNGLVFEFHYRSKIARDFVMSVPAAPDHVWEPQTTRVLLQLAHDDAIVGGAYFGDHAIPLAHALRDRGTVHAFEPDAEQAAMLEHNARLNALDNIRVHALGLWSDADTHLSFVGHDALASTVAAESGIPTTTIDRSATTRIGLIMLDLEGAELHVLRGAERVLREHGPHVVFEIHRSYVDWTDGLHKTEIAQYLAALGYTLFGIRDFQSNYDLSGHPVELVPIETAYLDGPPHGFNVLAVRDPSVLAPFVITPHVSPKLLLHRDPKLHHPLGGL